MIHFIGCESPLLTFWRLFLYQGFKVSHFEKVLEQEVAYRDGRVDPHGMQLPSDAEEAFDANAVEACPPRIEQRLSNFKLMEGSDATFVCLVSGHPRPTVSKMIAHWTMGDVRYVIQL